MEGALLCQSSAAAGRAQNDGKRWGKYQLASDESPQGQLSDAEWGKRAVFRGSERRTGHCLWMVVIELETDSCCQQPVS